MTDLFIELLLQEIRKLDKEQVKEGLNPERLAMPDKNLLNEVYKKMGVIFWN